MSGFTIKNITLLDYNYRYTNVVMPYTVLMIIGFSSNN